MQIKVVLVLKKTIAINSLFSNDILNSNTTDFKSI